MPKSASKDVNKVHVVFKTHLDLGYTDLAANIRDDFFESYIPDAIRAAHPEIPWRMIIATRNRLIHGYLGIDDDTLWSIIRDDVPDLLPMLRALRERAAGHPDG